MFVVLGVIVVVTMLGFLGMILANKDNDQAGNAYGLKSQRVVAVSGLNLAIARFQQVPTASLAALKAFLADPTKTWLVMSSSGDPVSVQSAEPDWFALGTGNDKSAVKIQILGIGSAMVDDGLPVYLRSLGRGRDGDVYETRGVYMLRGFAYASTYPTEGPTDGLLARGGLENVDAGVNLDGGIYSGGTGTTKLQTKGASASFSRVRVRGTLEIYGSPAAPTTVTGNSLVGGRLKITNTNSWLTTGTIAYFGGNLVIGYLEKTIGTAKYGGFGPIDGGLEVAKSFYVWGTSGPGDEMFQPASPINKDLTVGENLWVRDSGFKCAGRLTVGKHGATTSNVWFDKGVLFKEKATTDINGRVDIGSRGTNTDNQFGGWFSVQGDFNHYPTNVSGYPHMIINGGTIVVKKNFATTTSVSTDNNTVSNDASLPQYLKDEEGWASAADAPCLIVKGKSWLGNGIKFIDRQGAKDGAGLVFQGDAYLNRIAGTHATFNNGAAAFKSSLTMNGDLDPHFGSVGKKWFFPSGTASPSWSYKGNATQKNAIDGVTGVWRSGDADFSAHPADIVPVRTAPEADLTKLGYSDAELKMDAKDNPASEVRLGYMVASGFEQAEYETIYAKYKTTCKLDELYDTASNTIKKGDDFPPSATQLACIYNNEVKTSGKYLWNKQYLVVKIANTAKNRFNNMNQLSAAQRVLPAGVKIFWRIDIGRDINGCWYSGQLGSVQILIASAKLVDFGWDGDFYGFIQFTGDYQFLKSNGKKFNLYGALEIADATKGGATGTGLRVNAGQGLNIYRHNAASQAVFSDIVGSFFSTDGVGSGGWIIRFNGDRSKTNSTKTNVLTLKDGWVQVQRVGEYR